MAYPTRLQVKQLYWQLLDDPAASVFTDTPNGTTGAVSVFQSGFSQAYDLLFNNALNQQVPAVEQVVSGIVIPPSPVPFSVTPAAMGLTSFADWEWISERQFGSTDKFLDLVDEDRLSQRAPTDRLIETVWQDQAFQFVGCTTVREIQIKYVSSGSAPTNDDAVVRFDNSLNFLANYAAGVTGGQKGYDAIADRCRSFSVGPKFDLGSVGGELFRLLQPLVRSRQNVQAAHKPYTTQRRSGTWRRGVPYVAVQQGTTGGGSQNVPMEFTTANGTITPVPDGTNAVFFIVLGVNQNITVFRNGVLQSYGIAPADYINIGNAITFNAGSIPLVGDILTSSAYPIYQS